MDERAIALLPGILFLVVGIAGFIPGLTSVYGIGADAPLHLPDIVYTDGYGNVSGLFPTNFLHYAVHMTVGILRLLLPPALAVL